MTLSGIVERVADVTAHAIECDAAQLRHASLDHTKRARKLEVCVPLEVPHFDDQARTASDSRALARDTASRNSNSSMSSRGLRSDRQRAATSSPDGAGCR